MSRYGKIESGFWQNSKVRALSERGRYLLTYLLSCPHGNAVGCFVLRNGYIAEDLGWTTERVSETVSELSNAGFIERDERSFLLRIIGWWGHNTIANPNVASHAAKEINALPNCQVKQRLIAETLALETVPATVTQTLSKLLPEPVRNQEQNTTEQEQEQEPNIAPEALDEKIFEDFWNAYPKRKGANPRKTALKAFTAAVKSGADPNEIIAGVKRCAAADRDKIGTPYIPQAVKWLHDERWKDYGPPKAVEITDDTWRTRCKHWQETGQWIRDRWGDAPGEPHCRVPAQILADFAPKHPQERALA